MPVGSALPRLIACVIAQRPTKTPRRCACGTPVYGVCESARAGTCATCALREDLAEAAGCAEVVMDALEVETMLLRNAFAALHGEWPATVRSADAPEPSPMLGRSVTWDDHDRISKDGA